ncbi:ABC transporter ATP-binding protein [Stratiformator vulcanicus]|uniref:Putative ABC transporter ATP-binding protein n=1 Tax=Stratiformator vulcanicus TaxID=2527980 RepID=A0A517R2V7_9PLAN|nr:ABC transporter ATP-binding protein [Stratiformator vulcanicus]QDT38220.1 putative ABC transporter ATP-binding protein [Stratiformator vulcanicus]
MDDNSIASVATEAVLKTQDVSWAPSPGRLITYPDFALPPQSMTAIIGPSGSGKTTLLDLLAGLRPPDGGEVSIQGARPKSMGEMSIREFRRENIGIVFQDLRLLEHLSVMENILLPTLLHVRDRVPQLRERAKTLLCRLELDIDCDRPLRYLAGGEKQRVAIVRAILQQPPIVLADEPTGHLDGPTGELVLAELRTLANECGSTILVATHDTSLLSMFDRVIDLASGIVAESN